MIDSIYTRMQCCRLMIFLIITNSSYKTGRQGGTGLCLQPVFLYELSYQLRRLPNGQRDGDQCSCIIGRIEGSFRRNIP